MKLKKFLVLLICVACLGLMAGCEKEEEEAKTIVYSYGDFDISYGEFYIYARTIQEDYQKSYGEGIWSLELTTDDGTKKMREVTIDDIVSDINRVKVMASKAKELDVSLSEDEKKSAKDQAEIFYAGLTKKDIAITELELEDVVSVIKENMLATKVYNQVISESDFEVSEEEARMTTFYDVVFECYKQKKDGTIEEFTDEQKDLQRERADEALTELAQEEDATYESIIDKYDLKYSNSYTMNKADIIEEYGESVAEKILDLSNGEVSAVVQSEYGFHIFKMINRKDEDLTKKNKEEIVKQMKKKYFDETYEKWSKKYDSKFDIEDIDMEVLKDFPFKE